MSLGSGPTVQLAADTERHNCIKGAVLWSGLASGLHAFFGLVWSRVFRYFDIFRNIDNAEDVDIPVFIVHAVGDTMVPLQAAVAMHSKLPKLVAPYLPRVGGHGHHMDHDRIFAGIREFAGIVAAEAPLLDWQGQRPRNAARDAHGPPAQRLGTPHYHAHPYSKHKIIWLSASLFLSSMLSWWGSSMIGPLIKLSWYLASCGAITVGFILSVWAVCPNFTIPLAMMAGSLMMFMPAALLSAVLSVPEYVASRVPWCILVLLALAVLRDAPLLVLISAA